MPFEPLNHYDFPPSFSSLYNAFKIRGYNFSEVSPEEYVADIKNAFEMVPLDNDTISRILSNGISQFSLSDVTFPPEEQEARLRLSKQAGDVLANEIVKLEYVYAQLEADVGKEAASDLKRFIPYLRNGGTPEDHAANKEFLAACSNKKDLEQAQYKEVMRSLKELGVNSPQDFAALGELNDEKLWKPISRSPAFSV